MPAEGLSETAFPTQSDAESWFGEVWHDLSAAGVAAVTLHRDGQKVYGPMSLEAARPDGRSDGRLDRRAVRRGTRRA